MLPALYAHRLGRAYGPDSSLAALHRTLQQPLDGLETDCCLTADGELVLLHDPLLDLGTTLSGWAHQRTAAEIRAGWLRDRDGTPSDERPQLLDGRRVRKSYGLSEGITGGARNYVSCPGPASTLIELSEEERVELERRASTVTLPFRLVQRARMILYAAEGIRTSISPPGWIARPIALLGEDPGSALSDWMGLRINRGRVARGVFPPEQVAEVKAIACELPRTHELPLSRFSRVELHRLVIERGVTEASASTIWRWLHEDAIKPWQTRSWIFPRDPDFARKAARVLDLYARVFEGKRLRPDEYVISADEKTQLQALGREHATVAPGPGRAGLVEFEYLRGGTLAYLAGWDVHHAKLFDRIEQTTGIVPFGRLVDQVMTVEPYRSARTVYWVVDNGSSHAGKTSIKRMSDAYPNAKLIHLPVHASWLNQIEIYFSIMQRKALTPNDFATLPELARHLMDFGQHYRTIAQPFEWTFTRAKLDAVIEKITRHEPQPPALAA